MRTWFVDKAHHVLLVLALFNRLYWISWILDI